MTPLYNICLSSSWSVWQGQDSADSWRSEETLTCSLIWATNDRMPALRNTPCSCPDSWPVRPVSAGSGLQGHWAFCLQLTHKSASVLSWSNSRPTYCSCQVFPERLFRSLHCSYSLLREVQTRGPVILCHIHSGLTWPSLTSFPDKIHKLLMEIPFIWSGSVQDFLPRCLFKPAIVSLIPHGYCRCEGWLCLKVLKPPRLSS